MDSLGSTDSYPLSYPSSPPEGVVPSTPVLKRGHHAGGGSSCVPSGFNTPASTVSSVGHPFTVPAVVRSGSGTPASIVGGHVAAPPPVLADVVRNIWRNGRSRSGTPDLLGSPTDATVPSVPISRVQSVAHASPIYISMPSPSLPQTDRLLTRRMMTRLSSAVAVRTSRPTAVVPRQLSVPAPRPNAQMTASETAKGTKRTNRGKVTKRSVVVKREPPAAAVIPKQARTRRYLTRRLSGGATAVTTGPEGGARMDYKRPGGSGDAGGSESEDEDIFA